jgi:hypothetical protein
MLLESDPALLETIGGVGNFNEEYHIDKPRKHPKHIDAIVPVIS